MRGEYDRARTLVEEAARIDRRGGDTWKIAMSLWVLALVMFFQGDLTGARPLLDESLTLSRREGYKTGIAYALYVSGLVAMLQGDYATAHTMLEESFVLFKAVGDKWFIAACLVEFAALAIAQGEWTWAARLSSAAEALRQAINGVLPPFVRTMQEFAITAARAQLREEAFLAAWAEGRTMTPDQALAAQGPTDAQVAEHLVISPRTVNFHLTSIYSKLQVSSRTAATRYAMEQGLI